ncbi:unnamed protein product [Urochloa humidicola]
MKKASASPPAWRSAPTVSLSRRRKEKGKSREGRPAALQLAPEKSRGGPPASSLRKKTAAVGEEGSRGAACARAVIGGHRLPRARPLPPVFELESATATEKRASAGRRGQRRPARPRFPAGAATPPRAGRRTNRRLYEGEGRRRNRGGGRAAAPAGRRPAAAAGSRMPRARSSSSTAPLFHAQASSASLRKSSAASCPAEPSRSGPGMAGDGGDAEEELDGERRRAEGVRAAALGRRPTPPPRGAQRRR